MSKRLLNILKYLVFVGIGGFLFYLAFKDTEFEKLVEDFKQAKYEYVIASIVMGYLAFISRGIRWKYLLEPIGYKANTWHAVHAITIGYFSNLLIPRAGELARCTALNQMDDIPVNKLFGTVILERIIDMIMLLGIMLTVFITQSERILDLISTGQSNSAAQSSSGLAWKLILAALVLGGLILLYLIRNKFSTNPYYLKVRDFLLGLKEGLASIKKLERKWSFLAHTFFIWFMYYLMVYIVVFALPATRDIDPLSGMFIMVAGGFGMVIPSPGGIGSYHYLVMLACSVLGFASTDGVSFATLVHSGQTIMTVVSGLITFGLVYSIRKKKKKAKLTNG